MKRKIKVLNSAQLIFPSTSVNESLSRSFVSSFMMIANPTVEELSDLKCAVSEAVTNSIIHGYAGSAGYIKLKAQILADLTVIIDIIDKGCGIEDVESAMKPQFTTNTDGERSGMGFTVMKAFCDRVRVSSKQGKGTKVKLLKKLSGD